jgi:hypothetical protein
MAEDNPWVIAAARGQIVAAIESLCEGKSAEQRAAIGEEIAALVRAVARGEPPHPTD